MNTAEDKNELGHRNFNRSGFCLIYCLHILFFSFVLFHKISFCVMKRCNDLRRLCSPASSYLFTGRFTLVHIGNINENNSVGRIYERGIEDLAPILPPTAYTCSGVLLGKYPCLFLLQSCTAIEGNNFRILIKVVYQYFTYSHFQLQKCATAVASTTDPRNVNRPTFINLIVM